MNDKKMEAMENRNPSMCENVKNKEDKYFMTTIPITSLRNFKDKQHIMIEDMRMTELVESIKICGIISPLIVRESGNGTYEVISGYRRWLAAKLAGLSEIPVDIRDMTDEEAIVVMENTNIYCREYPASEMALANKMRAEALERIRRNS